MKVSLPRIRRGRNALRSGGSNHTARGSPEAIDGDHGGAAVAVVEVEMEDAGRGAGAAPRLGARARRALQRRAHLPHLIRPHPDRERIRSRSVPFDCPE